MRRFVVLLANCVALSALAGCQYGPLDLEENQPQIADAFVERDFVVSGTSIITYRENDSGSIGGFICTIEQEIQGWRAPDLNDAACVGCEDVYTLAFRTVEGGDCEYGAGASADVGITPLGFFSQASEDESFLNWLNDNEADAYVNSTWYPRGSHAWEPRLGAFRRETPTSPFTQGPWECEADWCMETRYWYGSADWYAKWWMAVEIDE